MNVSAKALEGWRSQQAGDFATAERTYRQALQSNPDQAEVWLLLGALCRDRGRLDEAVAHVRQAARIRPDFAEAHNLLGITLVARGDLAGALASFRRVGELKPGAADPHTNAGNVLKQLGRLDEALASFRHALSLDPDNAVTLLNLGNLLQEQGQFAEAEEFCRRAVRLKPDFAEAHYNLGVVLSGQGRTREGIACYEQALRIRPDHAQALNNLGSALKDLDEHDRAVSYFRRSLDVMPDFALARLNLGNTFQEQGKLDEAAECFRQALVSSPDYPEAENNLGNVLKDQGRLAEAEAAFRRALTIRPGFPLALSNLAFLHNYFPGSTIAGLARVHAEWEERHGAPLKSHWRPFANTRDPDRTLRIGLVSPDLGLHPVGFFLIRCIESLDPGRCEVVCYSDRLRKDELTARFAAAARTWRDTRGMPDAALAELVRSDGIDILFDHVGHLAGSRLLAFARRPAPVQMGWVGYGCGTGLAAIDYLVADRFHVPAGAERHYREKVLRLPDGYVTYDPPSYAPDVGPLPARSRGYVTFGSFNNTAKVTPEVVAAWAEVLRRVPRSRLVLKYLGFGDESTRARYASQFSALGVDPARVDMLGKTPHAEMLEVYNQVDVGLDPFPFCGGLTSCEALWMGVPVVTLPGETFISRQSLSHLSNVGLTETIAGYLTEYVDLAVKLAQDLPRLEALRAGLRDRVARSPLCDGPRFAGDFQDALRAVWREWCAAPEPSTDPR